MIKEAYELGMESYLEKIALKPETYFNAAAGITRKAREANAAGKIGLKAFDKQLDRASRLTSFGSKKFQAQVKR